jgi:hypothetical protein
MIAWSNKPPTYQEWRDANNHGVWWVKFILTPEEIDEDGTTWPETWYTDVVTIAVEYKKGLLDPDGAVLHARGHILDSFTLDDEEKTKGMYWQPTAPPLDDIKNERPKV